MSETPPYTHKKITEAKDSAPEFGFGEHGEMRFAAKDFDATDTGFTYHRANPNTHRGFGHRHQDAEEVYVVLAGGGRMTLDGDEVEVGPMDAVRVAPQVERWFDAGDEGLELLVFGARHKGDGEITPFDA